MSDFTHKEPLEKAKPKVEIKAEKEFERKVKKDRGEYTFIAERLDHFKVKNTNKNELPHNRILPNLMTQFIVKKPEVIVKSTSVIHELTNK